ncbi:NAD(P)-dependent oxidoreductase [Amycolatopsis sp. 195334CR]|uniref:NAD(P)-dependent oxidoreductase n=1 Tax=Amycolatopsis sp. 195334CR TaxID=2814588 RepID=UPI001A8D3827|nr:NAD(P)-binding domain-containing protein [Amycolatopsis sp. 195334CR]MBN6037225.1 NAD(P)-dependent oxidoreductase [Amycolatopsis sp. 195334CR]
MTENSTTQVTFAGLGDMGRALAAAALRNGFTATVWNRTPGKAGELTAAGAHEAAGLAEAFEASPVVILCVVDNNAVGELLDAAGDRLRGRTVVNLTNGTPRQARELAERVTALGAEYVDGGIMAVPPGIGTEASFVLYAGPEREVEARRALFETFGGVQYVGEDTGLAALYDLALLSGMYGMHAGVMHAYALIGSAGIPATDFSALLVPWIQAMSGFVREAADRIDRDDFTKDVVSNLAMQAQAFPNLIEASKEQGVRPDLLEPVMRLFQERVAQGHGDEDGVGVIRLLQS